MFQDRIDAGRQLAEKVKKYEGRSPLVIALPRGGVVVGFPIAQALKTNLEVLLVRKLGAPNNPELGIGAIAEDGIAFFDSDMVEMLQIPRNVLQIILSNEKEELERRKLLYRQGKTLPLLTNRTVILVDDGLATGVTAHAAILSLKKHHPKKIIFAVPVCSKETALAIRSMIDMIICLDSQEQLEAIGKYYNDFSQVTDGEVLRLLQRANTRSVLQTTESSFNHKIVW